MSPSRTCLNFGRPRRRLWRSSSCVRPPVASRPPHWSLRVRLPLLMCRWRLRMLTRMDLATSGWPSAAPTTPGALCCKTYLSRWGRCQSRSSCLWTVGQGGDHWPFLQVQWCAEDPGSRFCTGGESLYGDEGPEAAWCGHAPATCTWPLSDRHWLWLPERSTHRHSGAVHQCPECFSDWPITWSPDDEKTCICGKKARPIKKTSHLTSMDLGEARWLPFVKQRKNTLQFSDETWDIFAQRNKLCKILGGHHKALQRLTMIEHSGHGGSQVICMWWQLETLSMLWEWSFCEMRTYKYNINYEGLSDPTTFRIWANILSGWANEL